MEFSHLEIDFFELAYGPLMREKIMAGAIALEGPYDPGNARPASPGSVELTALLMLARAIGTRSRFDALKEPGHSTHFVVRGPGWLEPVTKVLSSILGSQGRAQLNPHRGVLGSSRDGRTSYLLFSAADADAEFGRGGAGKVTSPDEFTLLEAASHRRTSFILRSNAGPAPSELVMSACDEVITVGGPDVGLTEELFHVFCVASDEGPVPGRHAELNPVNVALAFRRRVTRSTATGILFAATPDNSQQSNSGLDHLLGMDGLKTWAEMLRLDVAAVRSGALALSELPRGVLVDGPPGVGKTRSAGIVARHAGIPLVEGSVARWLGNGHGHLGDFCIALRRTFDRAASQPPCLVVIDELDALPARGVDEQGFWDAAVAALLEAIDGLDTVPGVIVMGLCNSPDRLDPALTRSGRIDHRISVSKPGVAALAAMFKVCLQPHLQTDSFTSAAARILGATFADVDRLCKDARRIARNEGRPVSVVDIHARIDDERPLASFDGRMRVAAHEAGHAIAAHLNGIDVRWVSLEMGADGRGGLGSVMSELKGWVGTPEQLRALIRCLLAGREAEILVTGAPSMGAGSDLRLATELLLDAFGARGIGDNLRWHSELRLSMLEGSSSIVTAVDEMLSSCSREVSRQLLFHRSALIRLRDELIANDYLDASAVSAILQSSALAATGEAGNDY